MASLELSRTVNDALQAGDFSAALTPLRTQAISRVSELPSVEKKSLKVIANALQTPQNAQFWTQALLDATPWVHVFAFKTLMRLGDEAQPIAMPLQQAILELWETQKPIDTTRADHETLDKRRAQDEMLVQAVELLFYVELESAIEFFTQQIKIHAPLQDAFARASQERYEQQQRQRGMAQQALFTAIGEILGVEVDKANVELCRLSADDSAAVVEQARQRPNVRELWDSIGVNTPDDWGKPWNPINTFIGAIASLAKSKKEPQKLAPGRLRALLRSHFDAGLQKDGADSAEIAIWLLPYDLMISHDDFMREAPGLLKSSREYILSLRAEHASYRLWIALSRRFFYAFYGYSCNVRSDWEPQDVFDLLDVLEPAVKGNCELEILFEQARDDYQHNAKITEETAKAVQDEPTIVLHRLVENSVVASRTEEESENLLPIPTRAPGESALSFRERIWNSYIANLKTIETFASRNTEKFSELQHRASHAYSQGLRTITTEDEREMLIEMGCDIEETLLSKEPLFWGLWFATSKTNQRSLLPLIDELATKIEQRLEDIALEYKNGSVSSSTGSSAKAFKDIQQFEGLLTPLENLSSSGYPAQFRLIRSALRLGLKDIARWLETNLLDQSLCVHPSPNSVQAREDWKLNESVDELLQHLAQRIPKWPRNSRSYGYSQLAFAYYRRFTTETRHRCLELIEESGMVPGQLLGVVDDWADEWMWLKLLAIAPQVNKSYFELWKRLRADDKTKYRIYFYVLNALPTATTASAATMMVQMLGELSAEELAAHTDIIASNIGSPHPKVARWALETLLKTLNLELDWPAAIDNVSGHLWGENVGVAKLTAKFLGLVPSEQAVVAWEKLMEALELENLPLVEAIVRALGGLKAKNRGLTLNDAALERLETLAQLAPERFGKVMSRFQVKS